MIKCHVYFSNNTDVTFFSDKNEHDIINQIDAYCDRYGIITVKGEWERMTKGIRWNRDANAGTMNGEKTYCPVNGWDCPYYKNGVCHIDDPLEDCDDWGAFWESWEDWEEA